MEEYMLIFRHEDGNKVASPEQIQVWMKQTMDWIGGIAAQKKFVLGNGLPFDDSKVVWSQQRGDRWPFWRDQRNHWRIYYCKSRFG